MIGDKKINKDLDEFLDSMTEASLKMDFHTFDKTVSWYAYDPLIAKSWTKRILRMIDDSRKAGLTSRQLAKLVPNPSELRCKMLFDLWTSKYADVSSEDRLKIFDYYNAVLKALTREDPYAFAKNIVHSDEEVASVLKQMKPASPVVAKSLGRAVITCYNLGYALYSDMNPSLVYENYGPYDVSGKYGAGRILAVKEFGNLRPVDLWPETSGITCDKFLIGYVYRDVEMTMDAVSHAVYTGDLINSLEHYCLMVDGASCTIEELPRLVEPIEAAAVKVFRLFQALDLEKRKEKYYFQKAYFYKRICERLGQDWRPDKEILDEAKDRRLYQLALPEDSPEQTKLFRQTLDPRTEFKI